MSALERLVRRHLFHNFTALQILKATMIGINITTSQPKNKTVVSSHVGNKPACGPANIITTKIDIAETNNNDIK